MPVEPTREFDILASLASAECSVTKESEVENELWLFVEPCEATPLTRLRLRMKPAQALDLAQKLSRAASAAR